MTLRPLVIVAAALALASASCVSSKKYAALKAERDGLFNDWTTVKGNYARQQAENQTIQALLDEARRNNEQLRADYAAMQSTLNQSISSNTQGNVNISKLVDQINASNKYIKELVQAKNRSDSLNLALTTSLTRSLTGNELDEVNVKVLKGVVYISLADNMLFRSGSYEVNSRAMQTLSKIAKIIKDYRGYSVLVGRQHRPGAHLQDQYTQQLGSERAKGFVGGAGAAERLRRGSFASERRRAW